MAGFLPDGWSCIVFSINYGSGALSKEIYYCGECEPFSVWTKKGEHILSYHDNKYEAKKPIPPKIEGVREDFIPR
jgi:hypothetical protein